MLTLKKSLLPFAAIIAVAVAAYGNILDNGFVYDDHQQILNNPWLRDPRHIKDIFTSELWGFTEYSASDYYRPLMHSLNLLIYTLFGPNRIALHFSSLALHVACSVLFFLLCRQLVACTDKERGDSLFQISDTLPLVAALLFAANPVNAEAVAWLGSSADLLYSLFCLSSFLFWLKSNTQGSLSAGRMSLALLLFFLATLCKETAFVLPLLLITVDLVRGGFAGSARNRLLCRYLLLTAVGLLSLLLRLSVLGTLTPVTHNFHFDLSAALRGFVWYLQHLLWPFAHNFYPELPATDTLGVFAGWVLPLLVLGVCVALLYRFRQVRLLWIATAFIVLPLLPALANSALGMPLAERYLYLPASGFCLLLARGVCQLPQRGYWRFTLVLLLGIFSLAAIFRNAQFRNDVTIWGDTVRKSPQSGKAMGWYATGLLAKGRLDEGIAATIEAIELGLLSSSSFSDLATALEQRGRGEELESHMERVLLLHPQESDAYIAVGIIYVQRGDRNRGLVLLKQAVALDPDNAAALLALGQVVGAAGDNAYALTLLRQSVGLNPRYYPYIKDEIARLEKLTGDGR